MVLATENQYIIVFIIKKGFANLNKRNASLKVNLRLFFKLMRLPSIEEMN